MKSKNRPFFMATAKLFSGNLKILVLFILILSLDFIVGSMFEPLIMQNIFNAYGKTNAALILRSSLGGMVILTVYVVLEFIMAVNGDPWSVKMENYGSAKNFFFYHQLPFLEKQKYDMGETFNRLNQGVSGITWIWFQIAFVGANTAAVVILLLWSVKISRWCILFVFAAFLFGLARILFQKKRMETYMEREQEAKGSVDQETEFLVHHFGTLIMYDNGQDFFQSYDEKRECWWSVKKAKNNLQIGMDCVESTFMGVLENTMLLILYQAFAGSRILIGSVTTALILFRNLRDKLMFLRGFLVDLPKCFVPFRRLQELYSIRRSEYWEDSKRQEPVGDTPFISAQGLNFCYGGKPIFENAQFQIAYGEKAAVIGDNGSGKSTLLKLLLGLYPLNSGTIFIDGIEVSKLDYKAKRELISYAPSIPQLFCESVYQNVCMGADEGEEERVEQLLQKFHIKDREKQSGTEVSEGQSQRTNLSRNLVHKARLYVFDEPMTALDSQMTKRFYEEIFSMEETVVIVTHDTDYLHCFDKVYRVKDQKIIFDRTEKLC